MAKINRARKVLRDLGTGEWTLYCTREGQYRMIHGYSKWWDRQNYQVHAQTIYHWLGTDAIELAPPQASKPFPYPWYRLTRAGQVQASELALSHVLADSVSHA